MAIDELRERFDLNLALSSSTSSVFSTSPVYDRYEHRLLYCQVLSNSDLDRLRSNETILVGVSGVARSQYHVRLDDCRTAVIFGEDRDHLQTVVSHCVGVRLQERRQRLSRATAASVLSPAQGQSPHSHRRQQSVHSGTEEAQGTATAGSTVAWLPPYNVARLLAQITLICNELHTRGLTLHGALQLKAFALDDRQNVFLLSSAAAQCVSRWCLPVSVNPMYLAPEIARELILRFVRLHHCQLSKKQRWNLQQQQAVCDAVGTRLFEQAKELKPNKNDFVRVADDCKGGLVVAEEGRASKLRNQAYLSADGLTSATQSNIACNEEHAHEVTDVMPSQLKPPSSEAACSNSAVNSFFDCDICAADAYSIGVCGLILATGKPLFNEHLGNASSLSPHDYIKQTINRIPEIPGYLDKDLRCLFCHLLEPLPVRRLSLTEALRHPALYPYFGSFRRPNAVFSRTDEAYSKDNVQSFVNTKASDDKSEHKKSCARSGHVLEKSGSSSSLSSSLPPVSGLRGEALEPLVASLAGKYSADPNSGAKHGSKASVRAASCSDIVNSQSPVTSLVESQVNGNSEFILTWEKSSPGINTSSADTAAIPSSQGNLVFSGIANQLQPELEKTQFAATRDDNARQQCMNLFSCHSSSPRLSSPKESVPNSPTGVQLSPMSVAVSKLDGCSTSRLHDDSGFQSECKSTQQQQRHGIGTQNRKLWANDQVLASQISTLQSVVDQPNLSGVSYAAACVEPYSSKLVGHDSSLVSGGTNTSNGLLRLARDSPPCDSTLDESNENFCAATAGESLSKIYDCIVSDSGSSPSGRQRVSHVAQL